jgi:N-acyl-D-amino-acid deacylase
MTGLSAQTFGITDRGVVREGAYADLVVFDPVKVKDLATFEQPLQQSVGIDYVLVNGTLSLMLGNLCPDRAGQVVRNT